MVTKKPRLENLMSIMCLGPGPSATSSERLLLMGGDGLWALVKGVLFLLLQVWVGE